VQGGENEVEATTTAEKWVEPPRNSAAGLALEDLEYTETTESALTGEEDDAVKVEEVEYEGTKMPASQDELPVCAVWQQFKTTLERDVELKVFDWALVRPDYTHVVYGKRRTGKTHYVRCLMRALRPYYPEVYVFTETKIDVEYEPCVPRRFIFQGFNEDILTGIMDRQAERVKKMRQRGENDENIYVLIILDDCITETHIKNAEVLRRAFFNGRHYYMSIIINSQDHKALGPDLRSNTDMVACFPVKSERDKEAIRTNYADFFKNDDEFDSVAQTVGAVPYNIFFIDQSRPYMDPGKSMYVGVMPPDEEVFPFFMGTRSFWKGAESQLSHYLGESLLEVDDWGIVNNTYKFKMDGIDLDKLKEYWKENGRQPMFPQTYAQKHGWK